MTKLLFITFISIILLWGCQKEEKTESEDQSAKEITFTFDSTALKTTEIKEDQAQSFFLRYKFTPGESIKYRLTNISSSNQNVVADTTMSESMNQTIIFIMNFKTVAVDDDSVSELECTFTSINLNANARGRQFTYQSGAQVDSAERIQYAEYESMVNNPFNLRISKLGSIIDIYKVDRIMNKFLDLRGLSDSLDAQQKIMASKELTNSSIKPLLIQIFREMPERKVAKDSSWSHKRETMPILVFQVAFENQYNVSSLELLGENKLAVITGSVKTQVTGEQSRTEQGIKYYFDKPKSTATGKIYFNVTKGMVQKSRTESKIENGYSMEMQSPEELKKATAKEVTTNVNVLELL